MTLTKRESSLVSAPMLIAAWGAGLLASSLYHVCMYVKVKVQLALGQCLKMRLGAKASAVNPK